MMHRRHQDILMRNRLLMVRNLKLTNVLFACLREDYTLTDEMQQEIEAEKLSSDKVGALLDTLPRRGDMAFDRFIRALAETDQDKIALALDRDLAKKYIDERDSSRMDVQPSSAPNDRMPVQSGAQPTPWQMVVPASGPQAFYPYGVLMMPGMFPMQNTRYPFDGMVQTLPTVNMTFPISSSPSHFGGNMAHPSDEVPLTTPGSTDSYSPEELKAILEEINGDDAKVMMDIQLPTASNLHKVERTSVYPMRRLPRGHAVIINNRYFAGKNMENRDGAQHDTENLKILFEKLSFTVIVRENLSAQQTRDLLTTESKHQDHANADAFVLFLLSHGNQGNVYGIDGEKLSIEDDITTLFDPDHCPALNGKPKLFFIQACQGTKRTKRFVTDSDSEPSPGLDEKVIKNFEELKIVDKEGFVPGFHKKSDMVMSYGTVKGYLAWRRSDVGSWFVRCLVSVFSRRAHCSHLIDMLTETNYLLSQLQTSKQEGNCVQLAEKTDTLIKKLYFFPGSGSTSKSEESCKKI